MGSEVTCELARRLRELPGFVKSARKVKSGLTLRRFLDAEVIFHEEDLCDKVARSLARLVSPGTVLAGLETGGALLAERVAAVRGARYLRIPKDVGVLTYDIRGRTATIMDDVYTTGGSLRYAAGLLEGAGAAVDSAVVLVVRTEAKERPDEAFPVYYLFSDREI